MSCITFSSTRGPRGVSTLRSPLARAAAPRTSRVRTAQARAHSHADASGEHLRGPVSHRGWDSAAAGRRPCVELRHFTQATRPSADLVPARGAGPDPWIPRDNLSLSGVKGGCTVGLVPLNLTALFKGQLYVSHNVKCLFPFTFLFNEKMGGPNAACFVTNTDHRHHFV